MRKLLRGVIPGCDWLDCDDQDHGIRRNAQEGLAWHDFTKASRLWGWHETDGSETCGYTGFRLDTDREE